MYKDSKRMCSSLNLSFGDALVAVAFAVSVAFTVVVF